MKATIFQKIIILLIIVVMICSIIEERNENFNNIEHFKEVDMSKKDKLLPDCKCFNNIKKTDSLNTPVAVNIPLQDEHTFNTLMNVNKSNNIKAHSKYCFPIKKFLYDGVWDSHIKNIDKTIPEKQKQHWTINKGVHIDGLYCGDKLLVLPEKKLNMNESIIQPNDCNQHFPSICEVSDQVKECCNKTNHGCDIIRLNCGSHTINGI